MNRPLRVLSLGAGVQSSTLALMSAHGEIAPFDAAIFADTQAEPQHVYDWLDWLEKQLPFPVHRVSKGSLRNDSLQIRISQKSGNKYLKSLIPAFVLENGKKGLFGRRCTADYKVRMIERRVKEIAGIKRFSKKQPVMIEQSIGISLDEAIRQKPSKISAIKHSFPLLALGVTRNDCLRWMSDKGYPEPPKSACLFCPFHSDVAWDELKNGRQDEWEGIVNFERELQRLAALDDVTRGVPYLHSSCVPIDQVDFKPVVRHRLHQVDLFGNECQGLCGV